MPRNTTIHAESARPPLSEDQQKALNKKLLDVVSSRGRFLDRMLMSQAKDLIRQGADVNATDQEERSVLRLACSNDRSVKIIALLLHHGAKINATDQYECTPLHFVQSEKVAEFLINKGADVNAFSSRTSNMLTPLWSACTFANTSTIRCLQDYGARINLGEKENAIWMRRKNVFQTLENLYRKQDKKSVSKTLITTAFAAQLDCGEDWNKFINLIKEASSVMPGENPDDDEHISRSEEFVRDYLQNMEVRFAVLSDLSRDNHIRQIAERDRAYQKWSSKKMGEISNLQQNLTNLDFPKWQQNIAVAGMLGLTSNLRNASTFLAAILPKTPPESELRDKVINDFNRANKRPLDEDRINYLRVFVDGIPAKGIPGLRKEDKEGIDYAAAGALVEGYLHQTSIKDFFLSTQAKNFKKLPRAMQTKIFENTSKEAADLVTRIGHKKFEQALDLEEQQQKFQQEQWLQRKNLVPAPRSITSIIISKLNGGKVRGVANGKINPSNEQQREF